MPQVCTICAHRDRAAIDQAIVSAAPNRAIARQWRVSKDAVARHKIDHLPTQLTHAQAAQDVAQADDLLEAVQALHARTLAILATAEETKALSLALGAIREARGNLELLAKLAGKLRDQHAYNILVAPQWVDLRAVIVRSLAPYPEARQALASVLAEVADGS